MGIVVIPRILHYVWIPSGPDDQPNEFAIACQAQAMDLHPGWSIQEHCDASLFSDDLLAPVRPLLASAWAKFDGKHNARSDLLRLCALYVSGGVYLDYDVWPIKPLDRLLDKELLLSCNSFQPFVVGEHIIGAPPQSQSILKVIRHFCRVSPNEEDGKYSPQLARFCWYYGWEAHMPDVFCPHPRKATADELYRVTPVTHAIHCWSPLGYDLGRLKSLRN